MVLFNQFCKINQEVLESKVMKVPSSLEIIQQDIKICKKCELCNTRNNAVPGIGDENADVVFIGEAPGKNEDLHGEPFIGTAGKRLDDALENAGLTRSSVYITNIVKCRPPNNRVPRKEISKNHGQIVYKNNRVYFISFHPAATIYNQKLLDVFKNDIKKLVNELQKIKNKN